MERYPRRTKATKVIICGYVLFLLGCITSCNNHKNDNDSFATVFEAYKWLGYDQRNERTGKIMKFLHNRNAKSMTTGIEFISSSNITEIYNYIAFCTEADFKHLNFVPLSKNHRGVAYIREFNEYDEWLANDTLKIYFPDSLQSKVFFDDAIRYGFRKYGARDLGIDSLAALDLCTAGYTDTIKSCVYFICVSEKDKNLVIFNCCP